MEKMTDTETAIAILKTIMNIFNGGPIYWIAAGILLILGIFGFSFFRGYMRKKALEASQRKGEQNESDNVEKEKEVGKELNNSNEKLAETKPANPLPQDKPPMKVIEEEEEK